MRFSFLISAIAALSAVVYAADLPLKRGQFYLQTTSTVRQFNGLWLYAYHTGAGLNDAILSRNSSYRIPAYLNPNRNPRLGGNLTFDLSTQFPWGIVPNYQPYAAFSTVEINAGSQTPGFTFKGDTLQYNNGIAFGAVSTFNNWLVCNWWHPDIDDGKKPAPQLFWQANYNKDFVLPGNCGKVELVRRFK